MTPLVSARNAAQSGKMQPPPQLASTMADLSIARRSRTLTPSKAMALLLALADGF
jgi:hypothetical protein